MVITPFVATPTYTCVPDWRGALIVYISCSTSGATIRYTWAYGTDPTKAPTPTSFSQIYRNPLYLTRDTVVKARAYKTGYFTSFIRTLIVDFWPYSN